MGIFQVSWGSRPIAEPTVQTGLCILQQMAEISLDVTQGGCAMGSQPAPVLPAVASAPGLVQPGQGGPMGAPKSNLLCRWGTTRNRVLLSGAQWAGEGQERLRLAIWKPFLRRTNEKQLRLPMGFAGSILHWAAWSGPMPDSARSNVWHQAPALSLAGLSCGTVILWT